MKINEIKLGYRIENFFKNMYKNILELDYGAEDVDCLVWYSDFLKELCNKEYKEEDFLIYIYAIAYNVKVSKMMTTGFYIYMEDDRDKDCMVYQKVDKKVFHQFVNVFNLLGKSI
jgi:hypothetical protein